TYPLTGIITCSVCGKHYRRKTARGKPIWICPTYNTYGKDACASKAIPEETLLALVNEIGGIGEITEIRAEKDNALTFILKSGERTVKRLQALKKGVKKCQK
ncbi:MAG: zinc ribbon domain-containing protein, partial [Clostridia bacterium]|nr:zinc ribbon domain-containing protein [Clostridia bacterium]